MNKGIIIIKLGGSIITYKDSSIPRARISVINRLAYDIKKIFDLNKYQLILVHGAGSFGHPLAKKYKLHKGMITLEQKYQFAVINQQMIKLNTLIINSLLANSLPVTSFPPRAFMTLTNGKLINFNYDIIKNCLENNLIPVLFGDAVFDHKLGCSIISGDTLVSYLAKKLSAQKVIFLSDVDGIFDKDPKKYPDAKLISKVNNQNLNQILKGVSSTTRKDVTGEMQGKIMSIKKNLFGIEVNIINGLKEGILLKAVTRHQLGTQLLFH